MKIEPEWKKDVDFIDESASERKARYAENHKEARKQSRRKYYSKKFGISLDSDNADEEYKKAVSQYLKEVHKELNEKRTDEEKEIARQKHVQYQREWKEKNPDKVSDQRERYRERKNQLQRERLASMTEEERGREREKWREYKRIKKREERARKKALGTQDKIVNRKRAHANKTYDPSVGVAEAVADTAVHEGVVILHGQVVDFNSAWASADADLRMYIITQQPFATDQELMDAYCLLHEERYGEPFDF